MNTQTADPNCRMCKGTGEVVLDIDPRDGRQQWAVCACVDDAPTAPDAVRDVLLSIRTTIWYGRNGSEFRLDPKQAEAIVAALTAAGFAIAGPGCVAVRIRDVTEIWKHVSGDPWTKATERALCALRDATYAALSAGSGSGAGGGE